MRMITSLLLACLVSACIRTSTDPVTGRVDLDVESPTKQGEDWAANMNSTMYPGLTGGVEARVISGETTATINLAGAPRGNPLPWHIHEGRCGSGGGIAGPPSAYPPLTVGDDGRATANARIPLQLDEAREYHVNVHASPSEMGTIIACGGLSD